VSRSQWVVIAAAVGILAFLAGRETAQERLLRERFTPDPDAEVVLLTTSWCGYCARARSYLERNGVAYRELDVERSERGRRRYQAVGGGGVPIFVIDGRPIRGLDLRAVRNALAVDEEEPRGSG